jgi:hypothetical protein
MALSEIAGASQAATVNTEHTLNTDTTPGTKILTVDLSAMVLGDLVELRMYTKLRTGSTEQLAYLCSYQHVQGAPNVYSIPVPSMVSCRSTLKQTAGTGHTYQWALLGL